MATETLSRKQQIIQVSQLMFRQKGFAGSSMREIAKEVGIEPASLYSHFKSKDEILKQICFKIADEFTEVLDPIRNSVSSPTEKLKRASLEHINVILNHLEASAVFFKEWRHLQEPALSEFLTLRKAYENGFRQIILEGITLCEFRNLDVDFSVRLVFSVLNDIHEWYKPSGNVGMEEVGEKMSDFILNGLSVD